MNILFIGFNHKSTPIEVRNIFSLNDEEVKRLLILFKTDKNIKEAVVLSTCNRLEIYIKPKAKAGEYFIYELIYEHILFVISERKIEYKILNEIDIKEYLIVYKGIPSIRHLFKVSAGLDSMIIGEDQILGQVKKAYNMAKELGTTKKSLNIAFRYAITCAKKIKTETEISKTSISAATLALKIIKGYFNDLSDKKIIIIGASGQIGGILLKNAMSFNFEKIWVTKRSHSIEANPSIKNCFEIIDYDERYKYLDEADILVSATKAPHYTIVAKKIKTLNLSQKARLYIDLAMPMDIDARVALLPDSKYYNVDNLKDFVKKNNEKKLLAIDKADFILEKYLNEYTNRILYMENTKNVEEVKKIILKDATDRDIKKAIDSFFYKIKDISNSDDLQGFLNIVKTYLEEDKNT